MNSIRIFLGLIIIGSAIPLRADNLWLTDLESAQKQSKAENKPILMDFTGSDWCPWCIKLKEEVFSKPEFIKFAKDNLVLLEVDFPHHKKQSKKISAQNKALSKRFKIEEYPTVVVLSPEGKHLGQMGYAEGGAAPWIAELKKKLPATRENK